MTSEDAVVAMIGALEDAGVPYMVVGSLASNLYGVVRATQDADFVIQLEPGFLSTILNRLGPRFRLDPQVSFELITATKRYVVQPFDVPFPLELFLLSDDAHDQERFQRRRRVHLLGRGTYVPTVEDVVVTKLRWSQHGGRAKDLDDARGVIAVQKDRIDWEYVRRWCDQHGTRDLLEQIRA